MQGFILHREASPASEGTQGLFAELSPTVRTNWRATSPEPEREHDGRLCL